jgi:DNA-binding cell septation regulator SpoVG
MKAWFLCKLLREKVLVIGFVLLAALIWLSSAGSRLGKTRLAFAAAGSELNTQANWLANRETIEKLATEAAGKLDASKTYDATFLVAEVMSMAKRAGLAVNTEPPRTQGSAQFAVHTVLVSARRSEMAAVLRFYQELSDKAPYLSIEELSLQGDRSALGMLNINVRIASVELVRKSAATAVATAH